MASPPQPGALEALPAPALITDAEHRITFANTAFRTITGYGLPELLGENCRILQGAGTDPTTVATIREALGSGAPFRGEILNYRKDGTSFWNLLTIAPVRDRDAAITHFLSVQLDVTESVEQSETAAMLLELATRLNAEPDGSIVAQLTADAVRGFGAERSAVALLDRETDTIRIAGLSGWGPLTEELRGFESVHPEWRDVSAALATTRLSVFTPDTATSWGRTVMRRFGCETLAVVPVVFDGSARGFVAAAWKASCEPLPSALSERVAGVAGLAAVTLDNLALIERIKQAAEVDQLTGLATRTVLGRRLRTALDRPGPGFVGVVYCDVDRFKWINDALGRRRRRRRDPADRRRPPIQLSPRRDRRPAGR